jgi:hypothetical protein
MIAIVPNKKSFACSYLSGFSLEKETWMTFNVFLSLNTTPKSKKDEYRA